MTDDQRNGIPKLAFYYPGWMWRMGNWAKNLILFFDGVALLVPEYMVDRPEFVDPVMVEGLRTHGLLHILQPESFIDRETTRVLADQLLRILDAGLLNDLKNQPAQYRELSWSRLGGVA